MSPVWWLLLLSLRTAELRLPAPAPQELPRLAGAAASPAADVDSVKRVSRGARDGGSRRTEPPPAGGHDPAGFFSTPRGRRPTSAPLRNASSGRARPLNPLFPVTDGSYCAYALLLLALALLCAGAVGNLALMCAVCHSLQLQSAWNCVLAGMALCDFLVLVFCLPVVVFHQLTLTRLLGDLSCRLVPYLEVTSLGVATFSLCALSIDRFHAATGPAPHHAPQVEPCRAILSKLSVIWVGSAALAAPELLLWRLLREPAGAPASLLAALRPRAGAPQVDVCVREPPAALPAGVQALALTYRQARGWWLFGCFLCLPLLFTLACDLVTRRVLAQQAGASGKRRAPRPGLRSTVLALAALHAACGLPQSVLGLTLAQLPAAALPALLPAAAALLEQLLLFLRCAATPLLLLRLSRPLGGAFLDCCCCCCDECLHGNAAASTTATSALSSPSPSSMSPSIVKDVLPPEPSYRGVADSPVAVGTPC